MLFVVLSNKKTLPPPRVETGGKWFLRLPKLTVILIDVCTYQTESTVKGCEGRGVFVEGWLWPKNRIELMWDSADVTFGVFP